MKKCKSKCSIVNSDRKTKALTQRRVLGEALHTHGLAWLHLHDGGVPRLEGLGVVLQLLA